MTRSRLDPFLLRVRQSLEEYAEYLDKGDPVRPEDNVPIVFDGPASEIEALGKAIPEHPKEEEYLEERWALLINEVESSRLAYFDSLYGTKTFYQKTLPSQERIAVDKILDKAVSRNKFTRLTKRETLFDNSEGRLKDVLLRKDIDKDENQLFFFKEKLIQIPSTVYDPLGRGHNDSYGYLKPSGMQQDDMGVLIRYMELENDRYITNTHFTGDSIFRSTIEDIEETNSKAEFFRLAPCLGKEFLYFFSKDIGSVLKIRISECISKFEKTAFEDLIESFQLKSGDVEVNDLPYDNIRREIREKDPNTSLEVVATLEELREYFFSFKDKVSYSVCKFLQFNPLRPENVSLLSIDPTERFLSIVLNANETFLTLIYDLQNKNFYSHYFMDKSKPQFSIQKQDNGYQLFRTAPYGPNIALWRHPLDSFISGKAQSEEITSLVRYMADYQKDLIDNTDFYNKGELMHAFEGVQSIELHQKRDSTEVSCRGVQGNTDLYIIQAKDGVLKASHPQDPYGSTKNYKYEVLIRDLITTIKRSKTDQHLQAGSQNSSVNQINLNYKLKSAVFLDDFVGIVVKPPKQNHEELVCRLDANQISVTKTQR